MIRASVCWVVALAGCDVAFDLTRPPARDAASDGAADDGTPGDMAPAVRCDLGAVPASSIMTMMRGTAIVAGNFNADALPDVAVASTGVNGVTLVYNDGGQLGLIDTFGVGAPVLDLEVGRIDGDTLDDLGFVTATTANALLQTASGWDRRMINVQGGIGAPRGIALGDFDGTGLLDLLVTLPGGQLVQRYFGGPSAYVATAGSTPTTSAANRAIVADIDGDGDRDVVVTLGAANSIQVLRASGLLLAMEEPIGTGGQNAVEIAAARFGTSTAIDLVVVNESTDNLTLFRNGGAGTFSTTMIPVGDAPRGLAIADLDGDALLDLLVVSNTTNQLQLLRGTVTGFAAPEGITTATNPVDLAVADFDGDGHLDVVVLGDNGVVLLHPTVCTPL